MRRLHILGVSALLLCSATHAHADCVNVAGLTKCTDGQGASTDVNHVGGAAGGVTQTTSTGSNGQSASSNVNVANGGQTLITPGAAAYSSAGVTAVGSGTTGVAPVAAAGTTAITPAAPVTAGAPAVVSPTIPGTTLHGVIAPAGASNALVTGTGVNGSVSSYGCGPGGCTSPR